MKGLRQLALDDENASRTLRVGDEHWAAAVHSTAAAQRWALVGELERAETCARAAAADLDRYADQLAQRREAAGRRH